MHVWSLYLLIAFDILIKIKTYGNKDIFVVEYNICKLKSLGNLEVRP